MEDQKKLAMLLFAVRPRERVTTGVEEVMWTDCWCGLVGIWWRGVGISPAYTCDKGNTGGMMGLMKH